MVLRAPGAAVQAVIRRPWQLGAKEQYLSVEFGPFVGVGPAPLSVLRGRAADLLRHTKAKGSAKTLIGEAVGPVGVIRLEGGVLEVELAYSVRCDDDLKICPAEVLCDDSA
jgi:hypothetical protein